MANNVPNQALRPRNVLFSLDAAVDELAAEISELRDDGDAAGVDIAKLFEAQEQLRWEISELDQRIDTIKYYGEVSKRRMNSMTQRIDELQRLYEGSKRHSNAPMEQWKTLEERMNTLQKDLDSLSEQLNSGSEPETVTPNGEGPCKCQMLVEEKEDHKEELKRLETRLKIESYNAIARTQNSFVRSRTGAIMPLKSLETGETIAEFPNTLLQLDKLESSSLRNILQHLGAELCKEGRGNGDFDSTLPPDPFGHLWRRVSSSQRRSPSFESSKDLICLEQQEDEETESLRRQLRLYIGVPMYGLRGLGNR